MNMGVQANKKTTMIYKVNTIFLKIVTFNNQLIPQLLYAQFAKSGMIMHSNVVDY